jgi:phage gpG-like protein
MENNTALNNILSELDRISKKLNGLQSQGNKVSEKGLALVEAQLKNVSATLEILEDAVVNNESVAVAEETIPVDVKEVVAMSLENTASEIVEVVKQPEPAPVAEKKSKPAKEQNSDNSLVAKMKRKPIKDLRTAIGINEKFAFIKLFGGDATAWTNALQKLNSFSSYWEAEAMLSEFNQKYKWKEEDETLQNLMDLVERRYM